MATLQFELNRIFKDHMILQQSMPVPVWGRGTEGLSIRVGFCGQSVTTKVKGGKWIVFLSPLAAGGPYELEVSVGFGPCDIVIKDVLVGEVWIAGGQSNMEFALEETSDASAVLAGADYPQFRYYDVPRVAYEDGQSSSIEGSWKVCTPELAKRFSAVAYHFSKDIQDALQVPVGIISCNWGGTSASCWMDETYLSYDEELRVYLNEYHSYINSLIPEEYERQKHDYNEQVDAYNLKAEGIKAQGLSVTSATAGSYPWPPPIGYDSFLRPSGLYHTMLMKIVPYAVRGVLFYQGESDTNKADRYEKLFTMMIHNWRDMWGRPDLPFLFVQLPIFGEDFSGEDWSLLREAQQRVSDNVPHTAMAVSMDVGERDDIHPRNKKPIGKRLALLARNRIYGQVLECDSPRLIGTAVAESGIMLYFNHAPAGLTSNGEPVKGFEMAGANGEFEPARAEIRGDSVRLYGQQVVDPHYVRYGWRNAPEVNLFNLAGLPVTPFRHQILRGIQDEV
ncbi:MAG: 9-O-acetylesterase [Gorillibacterium sp.]|nr:9-O-acetylesterase [Gorillibacterium sp.]